MEDRYDLGIHYPKVVVVLAIVTETVVVIVKVIGIVIESQFKPMLKSYRVVDEVLG